MKESRARELENPSLKKILLSIGLVMIILTSFFGGYFTYRGLMGDGQKTVDDILGIMDKVGFVYDPELDDYVALEEDKIAKLIAGSFLDGYSAYYTKEEYEVISTNRKGHYSGVGISILNTNAESNDAGTNVVYQVQPNSPAHRAGITSNDKIVAGKIADGEWVNITCGKQLIEFLRSIELDSELTLKVERNEQTFPIETVCEEYVKSYVTYIDDQKTAYFSYDTETIIRSTFDAYEYIVEENVSNQVALEYALGDNDAYVKLYEFNGDATFQFGAILEYMTERGKTDLILDLIDNGGGNMTIFVDIAGYLINNSQKNGYDVAITTEKLSSEGDMIDPAYTVKKYKVPTNKFHEGLRKISILANENTASASECLIGALEHYDKMGVEPYSHSYLVLVESKDADGNPQYKTYGKGIMQTTYILASGGALKLTTAKLLWPDGKECIHKKGITTDIVENQVKDGMNAVHRAVQILAD